MPPERQIPGTPGDWLSRAKGDLVLAQTTLPEGGYYEDLCFHAQQAAEKAIKAVYRHQDRAFRYTHDLNTLLSGLIQHGMEIPKEVQESVFLTMFAWETRYPGFGQAVSPEEYKDAVRGAGIVVAWAVGKIGE